MSKVEKISFASQQEKFVPKCPEIQKGCFPKTPEMKKDTVELDAKKAQEKKKTAFRFPEIIKGCFPMTPEIKKALDEKKKNN